MSATTLATVTVHALSTGSLTLPERFFVTPADAEARQTVPSLSFLIQHQNPATKAIVRVVLDLGMRRDLSLYPQGLQKHVESRKPMTTQPDVVESLSKGGLGVDDIDYIFFSHVHYDHVGMPGDFKNRRTFFLVGPGALDLLSGKNPLYVGGHSFFEADLLPPERTIELPGSIAEGETTKASSPAFFTNPLIWKPLGQFPETIDFFGDGSMYIVNAPGHLPGHINMLCRIDKNRSSSPKPTDFVYLGGDACHDLRLFTGERDIATWVDDTGRTCCIHADIPNAKKTLARLRDVAENGLAMDDSQQAKATVEVIFAHDWQWEKEAHRLGRFWPGQL